MISGGSSFRGLQEIAGSVIRNQQVVGSSPTAGSRFTKKITDFRSLNAIAAVVDSQSDSLARAKQRIHACRSLQASVLNVTGPTLRATLPTRWVFAMVSSSPGNAKPRRQTAQVLSDSAGTVTPSATVVDELRA